VPLTESLYVPGYLDDAEKVLVDVGTGYFIEVSKL
jgi:prefoldin alpha subunit